jgi:hypothetical protein
MKSSPKKWGGQLTDRTDQLLEQIFRAMREQIAQQRPFITAAAAANAEAWLSSLQAICGDARRHCHEMEFSALETERFLVAVLSGVYQYTKQAVANDAQQRMH